MKPKRSEIFDPNDQCTQVIDQKASIFRSKVESPFIFVYWFRLFISLLILTMVLVTVSMAVVIPCPVTTSFQTSHMRSPYTVSNPVVVEEDDDSGMGIAFSDTTSEDVGGGIRSTEAVSIETDRVTWSIGWIISWILDRLALIFDEPSTTVSNSAPTSAWTTAPITLSSLSSSPTGVELQARLDSASAIGNARLAAKRAAYQAWEIPSRPDLVAIATNAQTKGLKSDGITDNTAVLQSLLDTLPAGATLYFPAGAYRIDGPISITKPLTLFGEPGTVFDCSDTTASEVFTINAEGSLSSKMAGVTITGLTVEGPGIESDAMMLTIFHLKNANLSYVKFQNVGDTAIWMFGCADAMVDACIFDNVFHRGLGYGVAIMDYCDGITIRDSFFVTRGRHGVTTGVHHDNYDVPEAWPRRVTVENNYFENFTNYQAIDAHRWTTGPYIVRGNVIVDSSALVSLSNGLSEITDNVIINCDRGIVLWNEAIDPANIGSKVDTVEGNILLNSGSFGGIKVDRTNSLIQNNVLQGPGGGIGIYLGPTAYSPDSTLISGNVLAHYADGFQSVSAPSSGISLVNNWMKISGIFLKLVG